jgi:DNA-binding CsgD family transcriptional regulator
VPFSRSHHLELSRLSDLLDADADGVRDAICALLEHAVGGDVVHVVEVRPEGGRLRRLSNRAALFSAEFFDQDVAGHPRVERDRSRPGGGALRLSDVVPWSCWHRTDYYRACYRPLGIRDSLGFAIHDADGSLVWPLLLRSGRAFSRNDVEHIDALRPMIVGAWRRIREKEPCTARCGLEPEQLLHRHVRGWRRRGLTARECEVLALLMQGGRYRDIGAQLSISAKTIEHHVARIAGKFRVRSRAEVMRAALEVL